MNLAAFLFGTPAPASIALPVPCLTMNTRRMTRRRTALPGGSLKSKPTWVNAFGCCTTSAFLFSMDAQVWHQWGRASRQEDHRDGRVVLCNRSQVRRCQPRLASV